MEQEKRVIKGRAGSRISLRGEFHLRVLNIHGVSIDEYHDKNLIVTLGKTALVNLLGNIDATDFIDSIEFGTNNTPPDPADTGITGPFSKAIDNVVASAPNVVNFEWSLDYPENNGMNIGEYGLVTNAGNLFARKTRAPILKDNSIRLEGVWKIIF